MLFGSPGHHGPVTAGKRRVTARRGRVGAMDEKELTRWKKVWRERAVWV